MSIELDVEELLRSIDHCETKGVPISTDYLKRTVTSLNNHRLAAVQAVRLSDGIAKNLISGTNDIVESISGLIHKVSLLEADKRELVAALCKNWYWYDDDGNAGCRYCEAKLEMPEEWDATEEPPIDHASHCILKKYRTESGNAKQPMFIVSVNGKRFFLGGMDGICTQMAGFVSYEELIEWAGFAPKRILSVVYRTNREGDCQRSGSMSPGKSVRLEDGMVFDAMDTSNA